MMEHWDDSNTSLRRIHVGFRFMQRSCFIRLSHHSKYSPMSSQVHSSSRRLPYSLQSSNCASERFFFLYVLIHSLTSVPENSSPHSSAAKSAISVQICWQSFLHPVKRSMVMMMRKGIKTPSMCMIVWYAGNVS